MKKTQGLGAWGENESSSFNSPDLDVSFTAVTAVLIQPDDDLRGCSLCLFSHLCNTCNIRAGFL